jgi:Transposase
VGSPGHRAGSGCEVSLIAWWNLRLIGEGTAGPGSGYTVYPVNPLQASRYRERHGVSGAKSDGGDAHMLAGMVRTDSHQLRPAAGDSPEAEGIKVVARMHKTMIWERTRAVQRLRHQLREYFPAAVGAFEDLDAPDTLELPAKAPGPARAAELTRAQISAALKRARRRGIKDKTDAILAALRGEEPEHNDALRRLAKRLVGILHGCLKTRTRYDEATAWGHRETSLNLPPRLDI